MLIWQISFYSTTVFCIKVSNGQRNSLCIAWTWLYIIHDSSHGELYQYQTLLTVHPDKHFIKPIPDQEGDRRKHPNHACFICNVSKEALSNTGFEDSYKPKTYTSYWCSICKLVLCIDPCFRLYHTEKDYTSEIIKIARISVKPIQKDAQHV